MKLRITDTTDGKFVGLVVDSEDNPLKLGDQSFFYDKTVKLEKGVRFVSSNYIIDGVRE